LAAGNLRSRALALRHADRILERNRLRRLGVQRERNGEEEEA
jgi:hypothetical protein